MSSIAQDIKSGLKGIKGAGDAIRGKALQATDELLDPKGATHPDTAATQAKNRAIADQGVADVDAADRDIGVRHGTAQNNTVGTTTTTATGAPPSVPATAESVGAIGVGTTGLAGGQNTGMEGLKR